MAKKKTIITNFSNANGGFRLTTNNLNLSTQITKIVQEELEKPIPRMKEYYKYTENDSFHTLDELEKEGDTILECLAGGLVPKADMKPCAKDQTKGLTEKDWKEFATVEGTCPLMNDGSGKPCQLAYDQNLVCKIHYYLKLKSVYVGKAKKQKELI